MQGRKEAESFSQDLGIPFLTALGPVSQSHLGQPTLDLLCSAALVPGTRGQLRAEEAGAQAPRNTWNVLFFTELVFWGLSSSQGTWGPSRLPEGVSGPHVYPQWSFVVATITEIPPVIFLPNFLVQRKVLRPLRTQTGGTIMVGSRMGVHRVALSPCALLHLPPTL